MGDISAEPSMEDILSSIKRIIAEEGEGTQARARRPQRAATTADPVPPPTARAAAPAAIPADEEVLELSDPMPLADPDLDTPVKMSRPEASSQPASPASEPILSKETAAASRGSLDTLSKLLTKPEPGSDGTLEGLVRELLRPMLREWLDANLPDLVETLVAREIERISGAPR